MLVAYLSVLALVSGAVMADHKAISSSARAEVESSQCVPTCAVPNPHCLDELLNTTHGCQCQSGYILSEFGGECIKIENCPKPISCNGDPHARLKKYPLPCPSTCESPDAVDCKKECDPVGCECENGYLLSEINGKCILPDECKGGDPCGPNGTFAQCTSFGPYDYCPVDDSRDIKIYEFYPFRPCYSGCICKKNYKRKNFEDNRCILASDCPPVECKRQNEVWNSCPKCQAEFCPDVDKRPSVCCTDMYVCDPNCICKEDFFRNASDICIPAHECRKLNAKNNGWAFLSD